MWEIKIINKEKLPNWIKENEPVYDSRAERWARRGLVKLVRHFRWNTTKKICSTCKCLRRIKKKVYTDEEGGRRK